MYTDCTPQQFTYKINSPIIHYQHSRSSKFVRFEYDYYYVAYVSNENYVFNEKRKKKNNPFNPFI